MTRKNLPARRSQTNQNRPSVQPLAEARKAVHLLAQAAGLTYEDVKARLFHIAIETPISEAVTRDLIRRIEERASAPIVSWRRG